MGAERSRARVATRGTAVSTAYRFQTRRCRRPPQYPKRGVVSTVQICDHHGFDPRKRSFGLFGPILRIEGTVFFGKTHRMSHYAKILQPPVDIVRHHLLY